MIRWLMLKWWFKRTVKARLRELLSTLWKESQSAPSASELMKTMRTERKKKTKIEFKSDCYYLIVVD